ncbi:MAG: hypothetical protein JXB88_24970 [Spirochaetales bacterium]|nr:hypothetical protein [Spirochaetales bacterium]
MKDIPPDFKDKFKEIQILKKNNEFEKALEKNTILLTKYPNSGLAYLQKGGLYKDIGNLDEAIKCFKQARDIFPNTEKISLCLFHALWQRGLKYEALEEMKRFMKNNKIKDYIEILNAIMEKLKEKSIDIDLE